MCGRGQLAGQAGSALWRDPVMHAPPETDRQRTNVSSGACAAAAAALPRACACNMPRHSDPTWLPNAACLPVPCPRRVRKWGGVTRFNCVLISSFRRVVGPTSCWPHMATPSRHSRIVIIMTKQDERMNDLDDPGGLTARQTGLRSVSWDKVALGGRGYLAKYTVSKADKASRGFPSCFLNTSALHASRYTMADDAGVKIDE
jgi:hypothetical protein